MPLRQETLRSPGATPACDIAHPKFQRKRCALKPGHVGVHESGGMCWWGDVTFPPYWKVAA